MKILKSLAALVSPVLACGLLYFCYYAGFSGNVAFWNDLPKFAQGVLIYLPGLIAFFGAFAAVDLWRKASDKVESGTLLALPLILNSILVVYYLVAIFGALFRLLSNAESLV